MRQHRSSQPPQEDRAPIPTSLARRWELVRVRVLPVVAFVISLCAIVCLWRENIPVPARHYDSKPSFVNVHSNETNHPALMNVTEAETQPAIDSARPLDSRRSNAN